MFRSLSIFNYRVWFIGALVSNIGAWMQATAQNWVVLTQLTDNDAAAMGVTMALQFAPPLLLVGVTGWVADRFDRRKLIMCTQTALLLLAVTLGILLLTGVMTLPLMFGFALALGIVTAFDNPARQAFVSDVVAQENASNARRAERRVVQHGTTDRSRRRGGDDRRDRHRMGVPGQRVHVPRDDLGPADHAAARARDAPPTRRTARLADGFRYVARRPDLVVIFVMVFLLGAFGMNFRSSPRRWRWNSAGAPRVRPAQLVRRDRLALRALLAARRERARMRVVILGAGGFAVASLLSVLAPSYETYAATLVLTGFCVVTTLTTANGYVQTTTDPALRGRVLALYMAILLGGTPVAPPSSVPWPPSSDPAWRSPSPPPRRPHRVRHRDHVDPRLGARSPPRDEAVPAHHRRDTADRDRAPRAEDFSDEIAGTTPIALPSGERPARIAPRPRHGA